MTWTINDQVNGTGVDLTTIATTWTSGLRQAVGAQPEVNWAIDASSASTGKLVLSLTGSQTSSMVNGNSTAHWYFDVEGTGGSTSPQTLYKGQLVIYPRVS